MPENTASPLPYVSVVIPALNCRGDIEDCLAALERQDYPRDRFEVIVADNGSTDGTREYLKHSWAKLCLCPERGRARALNAGLELASGEIICTTDMSCRAESNWIRTIVEDFADPTVGCVAGEIKLFDSALRGRVIDFQRRANYMSPMLALQRKKIPFMPFADGANASFRRKVFDEIGGFESSFIKAADVEICYRLFALTHYRILFDYRALMWEPGEPSLGALLHQRLRMGIGWNLMRMKYPLLYAESGSRSAQAIYWSCRAAVGEAGAFLFRNIQALFGRDRAANHDDNIRFLMSQVQSFGRVYGRWHLRRRGIAPTPLDARAQLRLIAAGGVADRVVVRGEEATKP
ncbi:MAG: glycosyltransferase [Pseudomonadota bacterium]|nr:glycosyltransferase [Pseudomonadota bacterium]